MEKVARTRIEIPYKPRPLQLRFHDERTRFTVMICHRRFGKTVAAINDMLRESIASGRADFRGAYMAPYRHQVKTITWDYLKHFSGVIPGVRFNESELACRLPNGASIRLFGADNADALRGMYLDDLVLDEPADMPREVWTSVVRPMLADRKGRALFVGTPAGTENLLYDLWEEAGRGGKDWARFMFRASETGYIDAEELESARASMGPDEYAQEFECSFAAGVRGAYYAALLDAAEAGGRIRAVAVDPSLPVHTAWDLGMDDATAIWFFQVEPGGDWRMVDYYDNSGEGLAHYAGVLQQRGYLYGRHIAPHDIRVRELGTGKSRLETAAALGIRFEVAPALPLADGIHATRQKLPRLWFDAEKCKAGIRALRAYRKVWRSKEEVFSDRPLHDWTSHAADALRYGVTGWKAALDLSDAPRKAKTTYDVLGW